MSGDEPQASLTQLLKELESPIEEVRLATLRELERYPSLGILRAIRRVASTDSSASIRFEARRFLASVSEDPAAGDEVARETRKPGNSTRLRSLLADPDPAVRVKVIRSLAMSLEPGVPPLLESSLTLETDPFVVCALLQAVAATGGPNAGQLLSLYLGNPDPRVRATAVEALEATGDLSFLPRLLPLLEDPHHRVRATVARAIRAQERDAVLQCVDAMLADLQELTVRSALYVLRFFDDETSLPRLKDKLQAPVEEVRQTALASLAFLARKGSVRAGQLLARAKEPPPVPTQSGLTESLPSPVAVPMEDDLEAESAETRLLALREAIRLGRADMMPRLRTRFVSEPDSRVLATMVSAAGRLGTVEDVDQLEQFLNADDGRLRANAVEAIGMLAGARAPELLVPMLRDRNNRARANAIVALQSAEGIDVAALLREMAQTSSPGFAASAIWAASTIATPASVKVLGDLAAGADPDVAARARNALTALAPVMKEAGQALRDAGDPTPLAGMAVPLPEARYQRLLFDLRHDSAQVRLATVRQIATAQDTRLLAAARDLLRDDDGTVRHAAREAVRAMLHAAAPPEGDTAGLAAFEKELAGGEERARRALASVLDVAMRAGVSATAEVLTRRLPSEENSFVRANILSGLALIGDASSVKLIQAFLRDPDPRVRANAVDALDLTGTPQDLQAAVACLADPDPRVRAAAITASIPLYKEPFLTHLRNMLRSETVAERAAGLYAVRTVMIAERFELLREHFLSETQPKLYEACADALARETAAGRGPDLATLVAELGDGNKKQALQSAIQAVAHPLAQQPAPEDMDPRELKNPLDLFNSFSQILDLKQLGAMTPEAIRFALARQTDPLAVSFLLEMAAELKLPDVVDLAQQYVRSKDRRIRLAASEALGKMDNPDSAESLALLVRDRDPEVGRRALESLQRLGPDAALSGVRSLVELGQPWAVRRALELLEALKTPSCMPLVLEVLERGGNPAIVEPLSRLVLAWGDSGTFEAIAGLYERCPPNSRPFLMELGAALGLQLALPTDAVAARFPGEPPSGAVLPATAPARKPTRIAPAAGAASFSRSAPLPPSREFEITPPVVAAGATMLLLLFAVAAWSLAPGARSAGVGRPEVYASAAARSNEPRIDFTTPHATAPSGPEFAAPASGAFAELDQPPTLQEVEANLALTLAPKGIKSAALVHLVALDRVQESYRNDIVRARESAKAGDWDAAFRVLLHALSQLDADHLVGRIAVLRVLESLARQSRRFEKMSEWRDELKAAERRLFELCLQAGRDSGMPEEKIRAALAALEKDEKRRADTRNGADVFSGAQFADAEEGPAPDGADLPDDPPVGDDEPADEEPPAEE